MSLISYRGVLFIESKVHLVVLYSTSMSTWHGGFLMNGISGISSYLLQEV
ncbi:hypothetical protein GFC29_2876 [Anoxybacillus sp. B7M1]|nr:hypothetical protein GFC28_2559 [Anoxybacillus sp. B2M1]ANB65747.1 hypothetical protein GFC29_2876 [Anoxybacillus sp. B7M1]KXG08720.1 hypothetical protein AT864_03000 [Anoxybacillus sp. P3H1B]MBB3909050.1 hypothetical protein [Anoxybacillus rupiensis]